MGLRTDATIGQVATVTRGISLSGRGAGTRVGNLRVHVASGGTIQDDRLILAEFPTISVADDGRTRRYLLHSGDLLVTGRSTQFKAALVSHLRQPTVADATLLIVRSSIAYVCPYLWLYFTSTIGRRRIESLMLGTTVRALLPSRLTNLAVPWPAQDTLEQIPDLVDVSERAYSAALEAAQLRRTLFHEAVVAVLYEAPDSGDLSA